MLELMLTRMTTFLREWMVLFPYQWPDEIHRTSAITTMTKYEQTMTKYAREDNDDNDDDDDDNYDDDDDNDDDDDDTLNGKEL